MYKRQDVHGHSHFEVRTLRNTYENNILRTLLAPLAQNEHTSWGHVHGHFGARADLVEIAEDDLGTLVLPKLHVHQRDISATGRATDRTRPDYDSAHCVLKFFGHLVGEGAGRGGGGGLV